MLIATLEKREERERSPAELVEVNEPFGHVPDSNGFIFSIGENEILSGMKCDTGDIVVMSSTGVHFPSFVLVHSPQLHQSIICCSDDQRQGGMKCCPIHSSIVSFQDMFDDGISLEKDKERMNSSAVTDERRPVRRDRVFLWFVGFAIEWNRVSNRRSSFSILKCPKLGLFDPTRLKRRDRRWDGIVHTSRNDCVPSSHKHIVSIANSRCESFDRHWKK